MGEAVAPPLDGADASPTAVDVDDEGAGDGDPEDGLRGMHAHCAPVVMSETRTSVSS
jgi:hypothetical protein